MFAVTLSALLVSGLANAASFQGYTTFTATPVWGRLTIHCHDGGRSEFQAAICEEVTLSPFEYGFFEAEKDVGANEVLLTSQRADGESVEKRVGYDSSTGRSEKRVNLWISTLFQKPILDVGNNVIDYQLVNEGEVKASGQLTVKVEEGAEKQCPDATDFSSNMNDCRFPQLACGRYFRRFNYCE